MTIRFADAWGGATPAISRALCPSAPLGASNDNRRAIALVVGGRSQPAASPTSDERLLAETLRHFARHGLAAAAKARSEAEKAAAVGDRAARDRWVAICRQLDRRMAEACMRAFSPQG